MVIMKKHFTILLLILATIKTFGQMENEITPIAKPIEEKILTETISKEIRWKNNNVKIEKGTHKVIKQESASVINLIIGDSIVTLIEGESYHFSGQLNNVPIVFNTANYRLFDKDKISFAYPDQFTLKNDDATSYSIVGDDYTLFVNIYDETVSIEDQVKILKKDYKTRKFEIEEILDYSINLNGIDLQGKSLMINLMGAKFRQDLFTIKNIDSNILFIVSDFLNQEGAPSDEANKALELMGKTLSIKN